MRRWSLQEEELLRTEYMALGAKAIAEKLGRTPHSVRNHRYAMGLELRVGRWTPGEVDQLVTFYGDHLADSPLDVATLVADLGRNKSHISRKARQFGLTNSHRALTIKQKQAISSKAKERIQRQGHPRGALGLKHTDDAKTKMSVASKLHHENMTSDQKEAWRLKINASKLKKYGTAGPTFLLSENAYSRCKRGRRTDIDNMFFRSAWEANYARYLRFLQQRGEIISWEYEPQTFVFHGVERGVLTYTPDFRVIENDNSVVYHEVKGWMDARSKAKLKRMAEFYPDVSILVVDSTQYKAIAKWAGLIDGWE